MYDDQILLVNKPVNWTSADVVRKLKGLLKVKKIGHAGTLDPLAKGLLIIGTGRKTKELSHYQLMPKTYEGIITVGKTTASYDLGTPFEQVAAYDHVTEAQLREAVASLTGVQEQVPPLYSALKIQGKRAYKLARQGQEFSLPPRSITVHTFKITKIALPDIHFHITCSKGTYIRSIARDLGEKLGTCAFLKNLVRTAIGNYQLEDANSIESLASLVLQNEGEQR